MNVCNEWTAPDELPTKEGASKVREECRKIPWLLGDVVRAGARYFSKAVLNSETW